MAHFGIFWLYRRVRLEENGKCQIITQKWNRDSLNITNHTTYTTVSFLRNVSGKSWCTINPAQNWENQGHTHKPSDILKPQVLVWIECTVCKMTQCCSGKLTSWQHTLQIKLQRDQTVILPVRKEEDQTGSWVGSWLSNRSLTAPVSLCWCLSIWKRSLRRLSMKAEGEIKSMDVHIFVFDEWTILRKADARRSEERFADSASVMSHSNDSVRSFCLFIIHR